MISIILLILAYANILICTAFFSRKEVLISLFISIVVTLITTLKMIYDHKKEVDRIKSENLEEGKKSLIRKSTHDIKEVDNIEL